MDSGNQVANIATKSWRTKESRRRVLRAITGELTKQGSPNVKLRLSEVIRFEANVNASAKTQDEYISLVKEQLKRIRSMSWKTVEVKKEITIPSASEIDANGDWQEHVYERNNMVSQDHRVNLPIGSSQHDIINQSSIVKGQSNAVKQQTNIAFQEFGVNNNTPRISATEAFGTRTNTKRILPLINESNAVKQHTNIALQELGVNNNAPRILATEAFGARTNTDRILPLIKESNDQNQGFHNTEVQSHAMQKLIRALTSISPEALSAAVGEIEEVVHLNDEKPEMVDEQGLPIFLTPGGWKIPRSFVSTTCDTSSMRESFNQFAYTAESNENQNLLAEIKDINNRLFDCEVVIAEKESAKSAVGIATDQSEGLLVKILYNAVTINQNLVSHFIADKKSLIEPLRLLIPSSYPSRSLVILDELPLEVSDDLNALSVRAKEKLRFNLGNMNEPLLIKDIARVWERCAREAILDYVHANGGGTFTSIQGGWEAC